MKKSLLLAAASLAVISCSKRAMENPVDPGQEPGAVRFASSAVAVTPSKVTSDADGSKFDVEDVVGIYAVLDGKKLGAGDEFPTSGSVYQNVKYKVTSVNTTSPFTATFTPTAADQTIYYLPGGAAYNYYAFYPTKTATGAPELTNYVINSTSATTGGNLPFADQDALSTGKGYPGPMMYAYYSTADKATKDDGSANTDPVNLVFKYANAKLVLNIEVDETVGTAENIDEVQLYATSGMYGTYTFDLKNASEDQKTKPVMAPRTSGSGSNVQLLNGYNDVTDTWTTYSFENIINTEDNDDKAKSTVTGYLIPGTSISGATIRITTKDEHGSPTGEAFLAELDRTNLAEAENYMKSIEAGKKYEFVLKISKTGVKFTGTITDWEPAVDGDTPEIPVI